MHPRKGGEARKIWGGLVPYAKAAEDAGSDALAPVRRVFHHVEEPMEIHLSLLDGIKDRYETPYFDNLKKYAQKPVGTFHALPVARGKSIFKSNWIRDMGEFYGQNLFLAETSATTGGLDSMLEPTGTIKVAQEKFARAVGADHVFFVTNGTSTSNKMVWHATVAPGDIVEDELASTTVENGLFAARLFDERLNAVRRCAISAPRASPPSSAE